jgi:hypothetical protein
VEDGLPQEVKRPSGEAGQTDGGGANKRETRSRAATGKPSPSQSPKQNGLQHTSQSGLNGAGVGAWVGGTAARRFRATASAAARARASAVRAWAEAPAC